MWWKVVIYWNAWKGPDEEQPALVLYERNSVNYTSLPFRSEKNSNAVDTPHHYLFGAVTNCLWHRKEESYLYKGSCLVWLESVEGIGEIRQVQKDFMRGFFTHLYWIVYKQAENSSAPSGLSVHSLCLLILGRNFYHWCMLILWKDTLPRREHFPRCFGCVRSRRSRLGESTEGRWAVKPVSYDAGLNNVVFGKGTISS